MGETPPYARRTNSTPWGMRAETNTKGTPSASRRRRRSAVSRVNPVLRIQQGAVDIAKHDFVHPFSPLLPFRANKRPPQAQPGTARLRRPLPRGSYFS